MELQTNPSYLLSAEAARLGWRLRPAPSGDGDTLQQRRNRRTQPSVLYQPSKGALGYDISIIIDEPDDPKWRWIVNVNGTPERVWYFRVDESVVGDRPEEMGDPDLETLFQRLKPAHKECLFKYFEGSNQ